MKKKDDYKVFEPIKRKRRLENFDSYSNGKKPRYKDHRKFKKGVVEE